MRQIGPIIWSLFVFLIQTPAIHHLKSFGTAGVVRDFQKAAETASKNPFLHRYLATWHHLATARQQFVL